jgi:catechol 2,3-dioxygenase-like lactoylglutathione lyase family enzyme
MPKITEIVRIAQPAGPLWEKIGSFGDVAWLPPLLAKLETQGEQPGAERRAEGKDGSVTIERLLEVTPERRRYRYELVSTPLPVAHYTAELRADDNADGTTTVRWSAEFDVTSDDEAGVAAGIRSFFRTALQHLASLYGRAPSSRLVGINHVALEVGNLEEALAFYRRLFDFELRGRTRTMAFIDMGDQFLALMEGRRQPPDEMRHFGLVVDDRSGLRERAAAAGARFAEGPGLEILDPWGNHLEIVEYARVQFTKPKPVLDALDVPADKTTEARAELRAKGIAA